MQWSRGGVNAAPETVGLELIQQSVKVSHPQGIPAICNKAFRFFWQHGLNLLGCVSQARTFRDSIN
jgi:hypothetical protein